MWRDLSRSVGSNADVRLAHFGMPLVAIGRHRSRKTYERKSRGLGTSAEGRFCDSKKNSDVLSRLIDAQCFINGLPRGKQRSALLFGKTISVFIWNSSAKNIARRG